MPGYGTLPPDAGTGLLPWSWAEERLTHAHDYWLATVWPDGRPHVMPVWGVWDGAALWFSCSLGSRKARNLAADPRCVLTTDNALEPVCLEGEAVPEQDRGAIVAFAQRVNEKYGTDYSIDFFDPSINGSYRVQPITVIGLTESDFVGSPTRWRFGQGEGQGQGQGQRQRQGDITLG
jgi:hypothetical protein